MKKMMNISEDIFKEKREERPLCDKCAEECDTKMKALDHKKTVHSFK